MTKRTMLIELEDTLAVTRALDSELRLNMLNACLDAPSGKYNVRQLQEHLKIPGRGNFRKHFVMLRDAGLIESVKNERTRGQAVSLSADPKKLALVLARAFRNGCTGEKSHDLSTVTEREEKLRGALSSIDGIPREITGELVDICIGLSTIYNQEFFPKFILSWEALEAKAAAKKRRSKRSKRV